MNYYIEAQIQNMTTMVQTFENSCRMAALKNDGTIDRDEERQLRKINAACAAFVRELGKIK